jgi:hypothetical protein
LTKPNLFAEEVKDAPIKKQEIEIDYLEEPRRKIKFEKNGENKV